MISLVPSESWGVFKWVWASARKWGAGLRTARCIWQGSGFAADQTNAMLAVVRADDESLVPPKPLHWVSAGALLGEVIKTPVLHFFDTSAWGWYHYPRRSFHAVETLDARGSRRRIRRFYATAIFALCGLNIPSAGTHATPAPNRAHSGSQGEARRILRVDGDDVFGSGIIDPIGPFRADQTVTVALAEGHRDTVSP